MFSEFLDRDIAEIYWKVKKFFYSIVFLDQPCYDPTMPILIVEPSPVVGNVLKLLCRRYSEQSCLACHDFDEADVDWVTKQEGKVACLIGGAALRGEGKRFLPLVSDTAPWQKMPKLVVVPHDATAEELSNWQRLPMLKLLVRPFAPDDFYAMTDSMIKGLKK